MYFGSWFRLMVVWLRLLWVRQNIMAENVQWSKVAHLWWPGRKTGRAEVPIFPSRVHLNDLTSSQQALPNSTSGDQAFVTHWPLGNIPDLNYSTHYWSLTSSKTLYHSLSATTGFSPSLQVTSSGFLLRFILHHAINQISSKLPLKPPFFSLSISLQTSSSQSVFHGSF